MKAVFYKTTRENYGAHDWDGTGECPQYWKTKCGLSTVIVVENVTIAQAQDAAYWDALEDKLSSADDYYEVSVYFGELVDDADWEEYLKRFDPWECPTYLDVETLEGRAVKPIINAYALEEFDASIHHYGITDDGTWGPTGVSYRYTDGRGEITHKDLYYPEAA